MPSPAATDDAGHPLGATILSAAVGRFPVPDGGWHRVRPWRAGLEAMVAFTGHTVACLHDDVDDAVLDILGADGLGGAHAPHLLAGLAGPAGWVSSLDVVVVRPPVPADLLHRPAPVLVERPDLADEPRVRYAARLRDDLTVYGFPDPDRSAVAIVGRGIGGLRELSYELEPGHRGRGEGATLVRAAVVAAGTQAPLVACVAPGNVASLRVLLACGFAPVGSVQLLQRQPGYVPSVRSVEG